jgi:alkyl hydroperoxide reductase subunit AhpC
MRPEKAAYFYVLVVCSGLFIIDGQGKLRQITVNDLPVGRSVDETLRLVQAFQYTDKHGEGMYID